MFEHKGKIKQRNTRYTNVHVYNVHRSIDSARKMGMGQHEDEEYTKTAHGDEEMFVVSVHGFCMRITSQPVSMAPLNYNDDEHEITSFHLVTSLHVVNS